MNREIGSEFHAMKPEAGDGIDLPVEGALVFSGRTAIETVLKELPHVKKAALPSYCCDSMIAPFRQAGITVEFYAVEYQKGLKIDVQVSDDADVLLWCNYFGYRTEMPDMSAFKDRGGVIIEDITHSLFSAKAYNSQSDYLVASVRKWEPLNCGGYCAAINGKLGHIPTTPPSFEFVDAKSSAMKLKAEYLEDPNEEKKQRFLKMFGENNHWLGENYSELAIDESSKRFLSSVNSEKQKEIRRNNAHVLYEGLRGKVEFLFPEEDMDCPLFVPIIIRNNRRNEIRQHLSEKGIYCPIHWPRPQASCDSNLYDLELSLICDQRYTSEDMERIVAVLSECF